MVEGMQIEGETPKRGPGRPPLRQMETLRPDPRPDSVREAERYAQELTDALGDQVYSHDEFHISPEEIPEGWSYQWRSAAIAGKENTYHMLELARNGWRPVPVERHPYKMPVGHQGTITIKGLTLMELPKVLTDKRARAHIDESRKALRNSEEKLHEAPAGTAPRDDPGLAARGLNKVKRDYVQPARPRSEDD